MTRWLREDWLRTQRKALEEERDARKAELQRQAEEQARAAAAATAPPDNIASGGPQSSPERDFDVMADAR